MWVVDHLGLALDAELATADIDMGPPGRPPLVQPRDDTDNFPDRPLSRIGTRTRSELHQRQRTPGPPASESAPVPSCERPLP
jgi:hypothetical protein